MSESNRKTLGNFHIRCTENANLVWCSPGWRAIVFRRKLSMIMDISWKHMPKIIFPSFTKVFEKMLFLIYGSSILHHWKSIFCEVVIFVKLWWCNQQHFLALKMLTDNKWIILHFQILHLRYQQHAANSKRELEKTAIFLRKYWKINSIPDLLSHFDEPVGWDFHQIFLKIGRLEIFFRVCTFYSENFWQLLSWFERIFGFKEKYPGKIVLTFGEEVTICNWQSNFILIDQQSTIWRILDFALGKALYHSYSVFELSLIHPWRFWSSWIFRWKSCIIIRESSMRFCKTWQNNDTSSMSWRSMRCQAELLSTAIKMSNFCGYLTMQLLVTEKVPESRKRFNSNMNEIKKDGNNILKSF